MSIARSNGVRLDGTRSIQMSIKALPANVGTSNGTGLTKLVLPDAMLFQLQHASAYGNMQ